MAPADKKLTVAYGVFSCTLEGFDDPVDAMAEVVERLQDVVRGDPHFGAVPPPPEPRERTHSNLRAPEAGARAAPRPASRDAPGGPEPDEVAPDGRPGHPPSHPAPSGRSRVARAPAPDPDLERLFATTDSRLTDEDASRRNATISHLKAAAAARRTDADARPAAGDATGAWREDLARVVRPSPHDRTLEGRVVPAPPLVLVSAQRVPREPPPPPAPDFPRDWARSGRTGAEALVLAAAAHLVRTTGSAAFSRQRLLALAAEVPEGADREAVQIAVGRLIRAGRLRRDGAGLYALAAGGDGRDG